MRGEFSTQGILNAKTQRTAKPAKRSTQLDKTSVRRLAYPSIVSSCFVRHNPHMSEPTVTPELIKSHGLTDEEYSRIVQLLGREPNYTELGIFSVMWSEHCSYKSSRVHLRRLPTVGDCVLQGPGENAGVVDIGGGLAAAFKIESHNHPSFIEPYQGAATGIGGILRDVFTMGARPLAAMNSLHFGPLACSEDADDETRATVARNRSIMAGVVKGIGDYGNA